MKRLLITLAMVIISSMLFISCGNTTPTTTTKAPATSAVTTQTATQTTAPSSTTAKPATSAPVTTTVTPKSGGTLRVYQGSNPNSLGYPVTSVGRDYFASYFCIESLFKTDKDGIIFPILATGYKLDQEAKSVTLTLRQGVKFHDGSEFNAVVCKWNLDLYRNSAKTELKLVTSVDIIDDYTVRLNLSEFQNTIISQLSLYAGAMISKAAFDANGGQAWCEKNPVGTGPFKFVGWVKDISIKYNRFDGYWGGKPYLDAINLTIYADMNVGLLDLQSGNLEISTILPMSIKGILDTGNYYTITLPTGQCPNYVTDATKPPFNNLLCRQAISYAVDTKTMAETFGYGFFKVTNQWAIPGSWGYNPDIVGYPYNPQKAKELLAAAGYPNGFKTTLTYPNQPSINDLATGVQGYLKAVGIELTLNPVQMASYNSFAAMGKGFDGMLHVMGTAQQDPLLSYVNIAKGVEFNNMLKPQEFKDAYAQAITTPDRDTKQKLIWKLSSLTVDQYSMQTFFWMETSNTAVKKEVKDLEILNGGYINASKAWLSK
jgi:peptide/nickel transport system substrate-binding protein